MEKIIFKEQYDLIHTFECGQIFRYSTFDSGKTFYVPIEDRVLKISQKNEHCLLVDSSKVKGLKMKTSSFLRLTDDYNLMEKSIMINSLMKKVVTATRGLHLLKQDKFECIFAFILSQCSNIPRIKSSLNLLAYKFGKKVEFEGHTFNLFPNIEKISHLEEKDFRNFGFGYRAKYLHNLISNYPPFLDDEYENTENFNKLLRNIPGIGQKVADCIQLFSYGDLNVFPVDTWMKKFMTKYFLNGAKMNVTKIRSLGMNLFGGWAGYAQEFIYRYARCFDPSFIKNKPNQN